MGSRITMIDEHEAEGKLKELYENYGKKVANILKVHSLFPESLETHYNYYKTIMYKKSPLTRAEREMIATVVSAENECFY
ncbi:peroxidase [Lottiidibacillus patelloidae]|uniref:Peroxidase n=3 Tax=Lottiidibacillus patelloidae TaxID=2670334 RepID=A0A263BUQ6_9BACI|nr:carboxymuconolactone decarboxylase family protein [Lottiidibacillus patelloidae]OZM57440.1 peroxidase [Lottiidibacillus patelloidae]